MNFRIHFSALILVGTLLCVQGDFTPEFSLKNIPKGLKMIDVIASMTQNPRYLAFSDHKKLKMLNSLIYLLREAAKHPDSEAEESASQLSEDLKF